MLFLLASDKARSVSRSFEVFWQAAPKSSLRPLATLARSSNTTKASIRKSAVVDRSSLSSAGTARLVRCVSVSPSGSLAQARVQDTEALIDYVYRTKAEGGLELDLDYILPFAALPENGREIDGIDDKSELAHRIMLTNLVRLLGAVKSKKASRRFITRPTQVILPLSPNHGTMGNDGLYGESKIVRSTGLLAAFRAEPHRRVLRRSSTDGLRSLGASTWCACSSF